MKKKAIRKYAIEAFLIVFSVLLALFLNKVFENQKVNRQERIARESLVRELTHNLRVTEDILRLHNSILTRIDSIEGVPDSDLGQLFSNQHLDLGKLTGGESLMKELLTSTGWETARSTGIIAEFEYSEVENLTKVYALQDIVLNKTLAGIAEVLFKTETHDPTNIEATLLQLRLRFHELVGQENILIPSYKAAVNDLRKRL
jgi:hypothetical protein